MPNWKKLVVSGSDAHLSNLTVTRAVTASYFVGDGSNLTNISIASVATVVDTFSNVTTKVVTHNFNSKNVIVAVYDNNDNQLIPSTVHLTDNNIVTVTFAQNTTGKVVVARGGHLVSGSAQNSDKLEGFNGAYYLDYNNHTNKPTLISSSRQISSEISGSFTLTSASLASSVASIKQTYLKNTTDSFTGSLHITGSLIISGPITDSSLAGANDRFVQTDSTGTLSATRTIITAYLVDGNTALPKLTEPLNWDINGEYTGPAITGTYQGQRYYSGGYFYEAVADDTWIRLIRG